jgi:hypothetical protein
MMNLFSNSDILTSDVETWKNFGLELTSYEDRHAFITLLKDYCRYVKLGLANGDKESFPSETLVTALIISQQKKIISWLICKLSKSDGMR